MSKREIFFCEKCGAQMERKIPEGDTHERYVCTACDYIAYENPLNIVGTIPYLGDEVLLCRRAIEPGLGLWALPAGHQEMNETLRDGAERETHEEAGAEVELAEEPFCILDMAHSSQAHVYFLAKLLSPNFNPGLESHEAKLFKEKDIPWEKLAFNSVNKALRLYFNDIRSGIFKTHYIERRVKGKIP